MTNSNRTTPLIVLALLAAPAHAQWAGKGEIGGVLARGNTETETINGKVDISREINLWTHSAGFSILRTVNDGVTSADRWELRGESDYELSERSFVFGALRYEDDSFTDYSYQASASAGYGYKFIDSPGTKLSGKFGVGFRRSELLVSGETQNNVIGRGAIEASHQLTDTTRLVDKFLVETGSSNTFVQNTLGLEVKINASLALGLGYDVRYNTDVQPGSEKTDQVLTANLVFGF